MSSTRSDYEMQRALAKVQQEQREKYEQEQRKQVAKEYTTELHRAVLRNDMSSLSALIQTKRYDLNSQDRYGNTALILAVMTRSYEAMTILMDAEAAIKTRNKQGWNALAEAISQGDRGMIDAIWKRYKKKSTDELKQRTPELLKMFDMMGDFHLTITWKFSSWVPFVSRFLPSDTYHIYKSGRSIRCDTTLVDFDQMKWIRGDVSFVCSIVEAKEDSTMKTATTTTTTTTTATDSSQATDAASTSTSTSTSTSAEPANARPTLNLMVWDNEAKTYTRIGEEDEKKDVTDATPTTDTSAKTKPKTKSEKDKEAEEAIAATLEAEIHQEEIDGLMSNSISTITMPGQLQFTRAKAGLIPGWKKDKVQKIGKYEARVYNVTNINFQVTKRWEHMSPEEIAEAKQTSNLLNDSKALQEKARAQVAASGATVEEIEEEEEEEEEEARGEGEEETETEKGEGEKEKEGEKEGKTEKGQGEGEGEGEEETSKLDKEGDGEKRLIPTSGTVTTRPSAESDAAPQHHQHHPSLPPPPPHGITQEEYFDEKNGRDYIHLGRPRVETTDTKTYKATAWMCDNFPLSIETVVTILEIVAPHHRHMSKLKDFVQNRLPDGFPIKIEMPVFPTITATIEFGDFSAGTIDPKKFEIPAGYREETMEQREARQQDPDNPNRRATQDKSKKASQGGLLD